MSICILMIVVIAIFFFYDICIAGSTHPIEVVWYGHATTTIYDGKTRILIDPFFSANPSSSFSWEDLPSIDYILLTHSHSDHIGDSIAIAKKYNAQVTGVVETIESLLSSGLPQEYILNGIGFNIGGTIALGDFNILMVPAIHSSPHGLTVGYFITSASGFRIYHAGDTAPFGDMKLWASWYPINLALLPIGGIFTQDAFLAVRSTEMIQPQYVIPIHYSTFPILAPSTDEFESYMKKANLATTVLLPKRGEALKF